MILRIIIDVLIAVSLYFAIAGTIGINKMPDTFSRMQASTLITTLGVLGANIGAILYAIFIMHNGAAAVKIAVIAALVIAVNPNRRARYCQGRLPLWRQTGAQDGNGRF